MPVTTWIKLINKFSVGWYLECRAACQSSNGWQAARRLAKNPAWRYPALTSVVLVSPMSVRAAGAGGDGVLDLRRP